MKHTFLIIIIVTLLSRLSYTRSPYRSIDPYDPLITTYDSANPDLSFSFCESHLHDIIFKIYDENFVYNNLLPLGPISYRYEPTQQVEGAHLSKLIEKAVSAVLTNTQGRRLCFNDFDILKARDINRKGRAGLYILKFKKYPFVLKLFYRNLGRYFQAGG